MSQEKGTKRATGATPLIAVAAAAIDTETTGLLLLGLLLGQQTRDLYAGTPEGSPIGSRLPPFRDQQVELRSLIKRLQSAPDLVRDLLFA
jgi:hypothetical protein